jgi:hypothetical protein
MPTLLQLLSKFENVNDRENNVAYYRPHVPWVAPEAYLNNAYKPADEKTLNSVSAQLQVTQPASIRQVVKFQYPSTTSMNTRCMYVKVFALAILASCPGWPAA